MDLSCLLSAIFFSVSLFPLFLLSSVSYPHLKHLWVSTQPYVAQAVLCLFSLSSPSFHLPAGSWHAPFHSIPSHSPRISIWSFVCCQAIVLAVCEIGCSFTLSLLLWCCSLCFYMLVWSKTDSEGMLAQIIRHFHWASSHFTSLHFRPSFLSFHIFISPPTIIPTVCAKCLLSVRNRKKKYCVPSFRQAAWVFSETDMSHSSARVSHRGVCVWRWGVFIQYLEDFQRVWTSFRCQLRT